MSAITVDMIAEASPEAYDNVGPARVRRLIELWDEGTSPQLLRSDTLDSVDQATWIQQLMAVLAVLGFMLEIFNSWINFSALRKSEKISDKELMNQIRGHLGEKQNRALTDTDLLMVIKVAEDRGNKTS